MAVSGKRLFWVSIIIVELVLAYVAWRPVRDHFRRQSRRSAAAQHPQRRPENNPSTTAKNNSSPAQTSNPAPNNNPAPDNKKRTSPGPKVGAAPAVASKTTPAGKSNAAKASASKVVIATAKPSPIPPPRPRARNLGPVVTAGLKTPEPIPTKPALTPQTPLGPLDSFWCRISQAVSDCDCKKGEEQAANHVMR
jgi:hypothetical protein